MDNVFGEAARQTKQKLLCVGELNKYRVPQKKKQS